MKRRRKHVEDYAWYTLSVDEWHVSYTDRNEEHDLAEAVHLELRVTLLEPIKGVSRNSLSVLGRGDMTGGQLHYDSDKYLLGWVWVGPAGAQALLTLLTAGKGVTLELLGSSFRYRKATIRSVEWFNAGHPDHSDW